jgi:preprotein translocase subunit SecG
MTMILTVLLTLLLVLDCLLLILLVLIQLPKKEAGAGLAFGGAATDALFGAGTGNVLTKVTKYATAIFFGLAILLILLQPGKGGSDLGRK